MRPMSVGELLDGIFTSYRSRFGLFVGLMLPLALIQSPLTLLLLLAQIPLADQENVSEAGAFVFLAIMAATIIVGFVIHAVAVALVTVAFGEIHLGRNVSIRTTYALVKGRVVGVLGLTLITAVIGFGALFVSIMIAVIPAVIAVAIHPLLGFVVGVPIGLAAGLGAVYLLSRLGVAIPSLVVEHGGVFESLRRSTLLVKGYEFRAILVYVLSMVISYVAAFLFQGPFMLAAALLTEGGVSPLWTQVGQALGGGASMALSGPLLSIGTALLYFDLRVRKEALDLEMAMLETAAGPAGSPQ